MEGRDFEIEELLADAKVRRYILVFWWDLALATSLVLLRDVESEENIDYINTMSGQPSKVTPCNVGEFFKLWTLEI